MIGSEERRRLIEAYREPVNARATLAVSCAGLLVVVMLAAIGVLSEPPNAATLSVSRGATDR